MVPAAIRDLVFLDFNLKEVADDIHLIEKIKHIDRSIIIVMLSGSTDPKLKGLSPVPLVYSQWYGYFVYNFLDSVSYPLVDDDN